jgi:thiaminase/transcriptional activator TenA
MHYDSEKLSVLVVAEWSYLTWGENVLSCTKRDGGADFTTYEWVDLHAGEYFKSVIECLRGLLDKEGTLINDEGRVKCKKTFLHVVDLEERFFDMAYNTKTI